MNLSWPLCFSYRGNLIGKGFVAHVDLCGRVLAVPEQAGIWLYGVNPGAVAVGAKTLPDANRKFRDELTRVFIDFAQDAVNYDDFARRVEAFFNEDDQRDEWDAAVELIHSGAMPVPHDIRRCPDPEIYVRLSLKRLEQLTPDDNPIVLTDRQPALAIA